MPTARTSGLCLLIPLLLLGAIACQSTRPKPPTKVVKYAPPPGIFETGQPLVNLQQVIPDITVELPYGTRRNVAHTRLYPAKMPILADRDTANKLKQAQAALAKQGRGLKIWDAYRPPEVQWELWRRSGKSGYVADPRLWWSKHCSGRAVDVTLIELGSGRELPMPSRFDDFSERAASDYKGDNAAIRENLNLLQSAMRGAGFVGINMEWWHFANATHYEKNIAPVPAAEAGVDLSHLGDIKTF